MADATKPAIQECTNCGTLIDVTDEQPLALRHCPNCGAAMRVRRIFNHFELQETLGAGGMGAVYRALDMTLKRAVALKLLRAEHGQNQELIEGFAKEAAITASINHPNVVKVYSTGTDHGVFYIAMELVDKGSLDDLMEAQGKVAEAQALEVGIQIAQGLNAAWQRGLIHRDVKPGNILFAEAHSAKIVDFGLAVLQEHANSGDGTVWGTPYYVAPEKLEKVPHEDFRSDMYSLGATLFHAIAGRPPFEAETVSMVALKHLKSQVVSIRAFAPEVSDATAHLIDKTLHKDPAERYASYEEFIENLQYARDALLGTPNAKQQSRSPGNPNWLTYAVMTVIVAGGVGGFLYRDRLLGPSKAGPEAIAVAEKAAAAALDVAFQKAREDLAAGKLTEAAAALRALDAQEKVPQPMRNWINLDAALAFFLAGQPDEARKDLQKVEQRGPFSPDPTERKLAEYFLSLAKLAANDAPQTVTNIGEFDNSGRAGFATLLLAAKDWAIGAVDEAPPLFSRYLNAPGEDAWIESCKPLAAGYSADFALFEKLTKTARRATSEETQQQALDVVRRAHEKLRHGGALTVKISAIETQLSSQLAAAKQAREAKEAEEDAADAKALAEALPRVTASYAVFKFAEAQQILAAVAVTNEKGKTERDAWTQRTEWLARFKSTLVTEINSIGYSQQLLRRNGTALPSGLHKATDAQAEMVTPYGNVPVQWTEFSVESIAAMAQAFAKTSAEPAPDRQWRLGVFLYVFGKKPEGLTQLHQAAEAKADYKPFLTLFPET